MLMIAATHNHLDIVQYLIDKGSNAYHQDQCGMSPGWFLLIIS